MPRGNIKVKHNFEDGMRLAQKLQGELPDSARDASRVIASAYIREATQVMQRQGNIGTGQGVRSFRARRTGKTEYGVFGADYLLDLHTGTGPHWPDTTNPRFIAWARMHGFDRYELAKIIARKGTRAHPWMMQAYQQTFKTADDRAKVQIDQAVRKASNVT